MKKITIPPDITIALLLKKWPELISVFIRHRMACVGCSLSRFETVSDAVGVYNIPYDAFHQELLATIVDRVGNAKPDLSKEQFE
jgi:hybrid cluster-associated redox disulfide protein